jgi:hypothetical protein
MLPSGKTNKDREAVILKQDRGLLT